jgi:hypothetical protein
MTYWTSTQIALIYFGGIALAILAAVLVLLYLKHCRRAFLVIWTKFRKTSIWGFKSSLIVAALLGALSVNYLDCSGEYEYLKESGYLVLTKGLEQIGTALVLLSITTGAWLLVFIIRMLVNRRSKSEKQS